MSQQPSPHPRSLRHLIDAACRLVPEITPAQARRNLDEGEVDLLLDVREREEWESGHIQGAVHAPRGLLEWFADPASAQAKAEMTLLHGNAAAYIIVYCTGEGRSRLAGQTLQQMGYTNVWAMGGGFPAWTAQGFPVE